MATFDLGRVTPLYKGDYSASASYELNDVVLYNGNLYWHVQATATVGILPTDTTVWKLSFADEGIRAEIRGYADNAQTSANSASASKTAAANSATSAQEHDESAQQSAVNAQTSATNAAASEAAAKSYAEDSAAYFGAYPTDTVEGEIASFSDGADDIPLKSLVVDIEPVQDTSQGDPSPTNICPISGWTGMTINANGTEIHISWESEAGTVYGGSLDVTNGVLTVDRAMVDLGTLNYTQGASDISFYASMPNDEKIFGNHELANWICTKYPIAIGNSFSNITVGIASINLGRMYVKDPALNGLTASQVQTAMSGVYLVYELATPITYQLTPTEVRSLLGQNHVWADSGDTTVEYRADTSAYVAKKIAEAISALS